MPRVALDSNILVFSEFEPETVKGLRAREIIERAGNNGVIPLQVYGELIRFMQRRAPEKLNDTLVSVASYRKIFLAPTSNEIMFDAATGIAMRDKIQFWDAIICAASIAAGASVLLTEDMQDGRMIDGLRIINPFDAANTKAIEAIFG